MDIFATPVVGVSSAAPTTRGHVSSGLVWNQLCTVLLEQVFRLDVFHETQKRTIFSSAETCVPHTPSAWHKTHLSPAQNI